MLVSLLSASKHLGAESVGVRHKVPLLYLFSLSYKEDSF